MKRVLLAFSVLLPLLAGCAGRWSVERMESATRVVGASVALPSGWRVAEFGDQDPDSVQDPDRVQDVEGRPRARPRPADPDADRVRLVSGEWLFGEILELRNDVLLFDSDELDELSIDWDSVTEVHSNRPMMVLLDGRETINGVLDVNGDEIVLQRPQGGERQLDRDELVAAIPGEAVEADYWSGGFTVSASARSGNSDQFDMSNQAKLKRENAATRARADYSGTYSETNNEEVANNQRATTALDVFLSDRLFVRPLAFEYFTDRIQGIDYRLTPSGGLGYDVLKSGPINWDLTAGAGWQRTRYAGMREDGSRFEDFGTGILSTRLEWDINEDVELDLDYQVQASFDGNGDVNQNLRVLMSVDLFGDFDLDVGFQWDRIGNPVPRSDGTVPQPEDYRWTLGLGWDF